MKPSERKQMAIEAVSQHGISIRAACDCFSVSGAAIDTKRSTADENELVAE